MLFSCFWQCALCQTDWLNILYIKYYIYNEYMHIYIFHTHTRIITSGGMGTAKVLGVQLVLAWSMFMDVYGNLTGLS